MTQPVLIKYLRLLLDAYQWKCPVCNENNSTEVPRNTPVPVLVCSCGKEIKLETLVVLKKKCNYFYNWICRKCKKRSLLSTYNKSPGMLTVIQCSCGEEVDVKASEMQVGYE